jgi:hypothetical protein
MKLHDILNEGGEMLSTNGVDRIKKEDIAPTLEMISAMSGLPVKYLKANLVGSAGKRDYSGDIDIAISIPELLKYGYDSYEDLHKKMLSQTTGVFHNKFKVGCYKVPIKGDSKNGYVQVDFMYTTNPEWAKFAYFAPDSTKSKYKGAVRTALLMATASVLDNSYKKEDNNGDIVAQIQHYLDLGTGLRQKFKHKVNSKFKNINPIEFERLYPDSKVKLDILDDPDQILKTLFGNKVSQEDVENAESVLELIHSTFNDEMKTKIFNNARQRLRTLEGRIRLPEELQKKE